MRRCLRCDEEMIEDLDVKVEGKAYGLKVTQEGIFKDSLGKLKCAVCLKCGYTETYVKNLSKIRSLMINKNN